MARPRKDIQKPLPKSLKTRVRLKSVPKSSLLELNDITPEKEAKDKNSSLQLHVENTFTLMAEHLDKLGTLLDLYNIGRSNEDRWFFLSLALAKDYVEGFKTIQDKPAGRKTEWTDKKLAQLYFDVRLKIVKARKPLENNIAWACNQIVKSPAWKEYSSKTLQHNYIKSKETILVKTFVFLEMSRKATIDKELLETLISELKDL